MEGHRMNKELPEVVEASDAPVTAPEPIEVVAEAPKPKKAPAVKDDVPDWVRAQAGDSYLSIAIRYFPNRAPGIVGSELVKLNMNRPVREGVKIILKENK